MFVFGTARSYVMLFNSSVRWFCAVICTASQTFAESFMRRHTSCVRRFCTIFSFIRVVVRVALHGGGKGDPTARFFAATAPFWSLNFYPLRCFDTGDILPCFPALNLRFCLQWKILNFSKSLRWWSAEVKPHNYAAPLFIRRIAYAFGRRRALPSYSYLR